MTNDIYEPREDSYLLQKYVEQYSKGLVLDIGTGSGIQAITAAKKAAKVIAADINPEAVKQAKLSAEIERIKNVEFIQSDLFENVPKKKFDLIIFNPPYLPDEESIKDDALFSGKRGCDVTVRFLKSVNDYLKQDGVILLISSSLASQYRIEKAIKEGLLEKERLEMIHIFFEDIFVLKLEKNKLLKELHEIGMSNVNLFSRGKRGVIITGTYSGKKVAVKVKRKSSTAQSTIENEANFLKKLNKKNIGPKLVMHRENFIMYEFVEGIFIDEFLENSSKKDILVVLKRVFDKLYTMDNLGINKFEMHRPLKHILIKDNNPVMIDFERCRHTEDPKNVTQFCDFLLGKDIKPLLKKKGIEIDKKEIIKRAKKYKENINDSNFKNIRELLK